MNDEVCDLLEEIRLKNLIAGHEFALQSGWVTPGFEDQVKEGITEMRHKLAELDPTLKVDEIPL